MAIRKKTGKPRPSSKSKRKGVTRDKDKPGASKPSKPRNKKNHNGAAGDPIPRRYKPHDQPHRTRPHR